MTSQTLHAFRDEMAKIAFLRPLGNALKTVVREGWHGTPIARNSNWNKALMLGGTGLMARDAVKRVDPQGIDRSRAERVTGLAGNTIGGMAGASAMLRLMPGRPFVGGAIGGIAGGVLGERVLTAPWAHRRADRVVAQRRALESQQVPA